MRPSRWAPSSAYDLVILDLSLPKLDGTQVLAGIKRAHPDTQVVMVTGYASVDTAIEAMKLGAYDYIAKPFNIDEMQMIVERALERGRLIDENNFLRGELRERFGFDNIIGQNPEIQRAYVLAAQVAQTNATVLILGETGTGKEFLARSIHYQSKRSRGPFVKVNCAALPETLLESELFGHEKGSFTGAIARRTGRFEMADGGSIFLDEIGDVSPAVQLKLLRVLQEKQFERVGGSETLQVDIADHRRDQPRPCERHPRRRFPRRPVLPAQRHHHQPSAAAAAQGRHRGACRALHQQTRQRDGQADQGP